jgi:hypothetical protein
MVAGTEQDQNNEYYGQPSIHFLFITKLAKPSKPLLWIGESLPTGGFPAATLLWSR